MHGAQTVAAGDGASIGISVIIIIVIGIITFQFTSDSRRDVNV